MELISLVQEVVGLAIDFQALLQSFENFIFVQCFSSLSHIVASSVDMSRKVTCILATFTIVQISYVAFMPKTPNSIINVLYLQRDNNSKYIEFSRMNSNS